MNRRTKSLLFSCFLFVLIGAFVLLYQYLETFTDPSPGLLVVLFLFSLLLLGAPFLDPGRFKRRRVADQDENSKEKTPGKAKPISAQYLKTKSIISKCHKCGMLLPRSAKKCPSCGTPRFGYIDLGKYKS